MGTITSRDPSVTQQWSRKRDGAIWAGPEWLPQKLDCSSLISFCSPCGTTPSFSCSSPPGLIYLLVQEIGIRQNFAFPNSTAECSSNLLLELPSSAQMTPRTSLFSSTFFFTKVIHCTAMENRVCFCLYGSEVLHNSCFNAFVDKYNKLDALNAQYPTNIFSYIGCFCSLFHSFSLWFPFGVQWMLHGPIKVIL